MSDWQAIEKVKASVLAAKNAYPGSRWNDPEHDPLANLSLLEQLAEAAAGVTEKQQACLENLRSHGVVFKDIGSDPTNWQHVAFTIYTDFCEAEAITRAALAAVRVGTTGDSGLGRDEIGGTFSGEAGE